MSSSNVARVCAVIAALGCAACSAEPPIIAQRAPVQQPKAGGGDVMVVVPTAGRTLLPYPETDAFRQCVPFARAVSGINLYGDAWSWWGKAAGTYHRGHVPEIGAVMVLQPSRRTPLGHVSVVAEIQDSRHMLVTHANWGHDGTTMGMIHERQPVEDMSAANDWSIVKMWNTSAEFGGDYQAYGFIYDRPAEPGEVVLTPAVLREERAPSRRSLIRMASYAPEPVSRHGKSGGGKAAAMGKNHAPATSTRVAHETAQPGGGHGGGSAAKTATKSPEGKGKRTRNG